MKACYESVSDVLGLDDKAKVLFLRFMRYCWPPEEELDLTLSGNAWTWAQRFKNDNARHFCTRSNKMREFWALVDMEGE